MAPRLTVVLLLWAVSTGCGTSRVVRLDTGEGAPREYTPPTSSSSVKVDADTFEQALTRLVLEAPLTIRSAEQGVLVRVSHLAAPPTPAGGA